MSEMVRTAKGEGLDTSVKPNPEPLTTADDQGAAPRQVFFDQLFGMHSYWWEYVNHPPPGYQFVLSKGAWDGLFDRLVARNQLIEGNLRLMRLLNKLVAPRMAKAYLDRFLRRPPECDLVFAAAGTIPLYPKPWVILLMGISTLTGLDVRHLERQRARIERHFASHRCKRIVIWWEVTRKALLANFDCSRFEHKMEMVPPAYHSQSFAKEYRDGRVKLLFVGSANVPNGIVSRIMGTQYFFEFDGKGGREVLEAFRHLRQRYPNLELVMRTGVPPEIRRRYQGMPGLTIIEEPIPKERLEEEFKSADIFIYPSHQPLATTVLLEAMSYELPIVALDVYAYPEMVQDGVTGLLVRPAEHVPYYWQRWLVSIGSPLQERYMEAIKRPDPRVVGEVVSKTAALIESPELRRRLGRAGRREIEHGKHSLQRVNERLRRIFDEALEG